MRDHLIKQNVFKTYSNKNLKCHMVNSPQRGGHLREGTYIICEGFSTSLLESA